MNSKKIKDSGPIYKETNTSNFIVEPYNTFSNVFFLILTIYWFFILLPQRQEQIFLFISTILVFIGWIGGTIYHAKRNRNFWIFLDIVPIFLTCLLLLIYVWIKINSFWILAGISIIIPFVAWFFLKKSPSPKLAMSSYFLVIMPALIPLFLFLSINNFFRIDLVLLSLSSFLIASYFRYIDIKVKWRNGTHWLWHTFGALSVHFIFLFIYLI